MKNNIKITYQLMRKQETGYKIIHQEKYIQVYLIISLNICESNSILDDYLCTIHIPTRGE